MLFLYRPTSRVTGMVSVSRHDWLSEPVSSIGDVQLGLSVVADRSLRACDTVSRAWCRD